MRIRFWIILIIGILAASLQSEVQAASENPDYIIPEFELAAEQFDFAPTDSQLSLPRQTNLTNTLRFNINAKRVQNIGFSKTWALNKAGQVISLQQLSPNDRLCCCYASENFDVTENLINLGRLII